MIRSAASEDVLIAVIGRGHSGTRILSQTLLGSGVFMGAALNGAGDNIPPRHMYAACKIIARHVRWNGGLSWDFGQLHTMPIDPEFEDLVRKYLAAVLAVDESRRGWKLPETTLAYPWIVRMFPAAKYVRIVRDPRDGLLQGHLTDDLNACNVRCPEAEDKYRKRVASWKYQHEIVRATPRPAHFISIRYEDLVLDQEPTLRQLEAFLGFPLARIVVDDTRVGLWKTDKRLLPYIEPLEQDMHELGYS